MHDTVWWRLTTGKIGPGGMSEEDRQTVERILQEPEILLADCNDESKH